MLHERNLRVSLCVQELCHPQDSLWILAAIPVCRNDTGLPTLARDPHCFGFLDVGWFSQQLFWNLRRVRVSPFLPSHTFTWHDCRMVIYPKKVSQCLSIHTFAWHSWRCHGWWSRWAWGRRKMINLLPWKCHGCRRGKSGGRTRCQNRNQDRNEVLRVALYPNTNNECGFWQLIHSYKYPYSLQAFRAIKLLAYPRGLSLSRIYPFLWRKLWPLHASALLHWLL